LVHVRVAWYWKRYMRKNRYHYKRYLLPLPKAIGDRLDVKLEYEVQLFGPAIVYSPKGLENLLARPEVLERKRRANAADAPTGSTNSLLEDS
jgi:hypothetical protein